MRAADWGIIYKEEIIEAEGMDESSAEMNKSQEWTLEYLYI